MIPWQHLASAAAPGGGELRLWRRGDEVSIRLGAVELMNSRRGGSEEALARLGCEGLPGGARVLIGGLGLGFTLRAALRLLPPDAAVTVAELVPDVIGWARGPLAALHAGGLDDPRTRLRAADVGALIRDGGQNGGGQNNGGGHGGYDAILLDVDNGPAGQVSGGNDQLYGGTGLAAARRALREGGRLAVWSAAPDPDFAARFERAGFAVTTHRERSGPGRRGAAHVVWVGRRR